MCSQLDDPTYYDRPVELAEVWCSDCDQPADGEDALCKLHRVLRESRKPVLLAEWDKLLIKMALQASAIRYEESAIAQPDDPDFITRHRKEFSGLAAEYRRVAGLLA